MNFQYTNVKVEGPSFPTSRASQLLAISWGGHLRGPGSGPLDCHKNGTGLSPGWSFRRC